jgi:isopenicillin N synthase-like dioxygenase
VSRIFPVIELEAVREPEVSIGARREIAHQVASACEEIGFFARLHLPLAAPRARHALGAGLSLSSQ